MHRSLHRCIVNRMSQPSELDSVLARLQLPAPTALVPWLSKLIDHPGSCIIIAIEQPGDPDGPRVTRAWLSSRERYVLRKALLAINGRRQKKGEAETTEIPKASST